MQSLDYIIIGGGVVGLAVGAALRPFGTVAVLEQHSRLIHETSSRNSQVVHAGLYYPPDSLKTCLSMLGNANIWRWHAAQPGRLRARRVGKWIGTCVSEGPAVAAAEERVLHELIENMRARGVAHEMVSAEEQRRLEPLVRMGTVVNSVNTGIIDVASLRDAFVDIIEGPSLGPGSTHPATRRDTAGYVACCARVERVDLPEAAAGTGGGGDVVLTVRQTDAGDDTYRLAARKAVVCAVGLHGNELWRRLFVAGTRPLCQPAAHRLHFCKGRYTVYTGRTPPVSRLVYPCPLPQLVGLGVHCTVDLAGAVRFGPDALYTDAHDDYSLVGDRDSHREGGGPSIRAEEAIQQLIDSQHAAVHRYLPSLRREDMSADFVGIRPKLAGPGEPFRDFLLEEVVGADLETVAGDGACVPRMRPLQGAPSGPGARGCRLLIATGVESPGLTASTAIGEYVAQSLTETDEEYRACLPPWCATSS